MGTARPAPRVSLRRRRARLCPSRRGGRRGPRARRPGRVGVSAVKSLGAVRPADPWDGQRRIDRRPLKQQWPHAPCPSPSLRPLENVGEEPPWVSQHDPSAPRATAPRPWAATACPVAPHCRSYDLQAKADRHGGRDDSEWTDSGTGRQGGRGETVHRPCRPPAAVCGKRRCTGDPAGRPGRSRSGPARGFRGPRPGVLDGHGRGGPAQAR
jgi:hypothetical protein